jgi:hypothetical protein
MTRYDTRMDEPTTHFGYRDVPVAEKENLSDAFLRR